MNALRGAHAVALACLKSTVRNIHALFEAKMAQNAHGDCVHTV
jgi:hypothetical protein